jgi:hypothetical protein
VTSGRSEKTDRAELAAELSLPFVAALEFDLTGQKLLELRLSQKNGQTPMGGKSRCRRLFC